MPPTGAARYTSQLLTKIKRHIDKNTLIVGNNNTPLSEIDRTPWQKLSKESKALNAILDRMDLIEIYIEHYTPDPKNTQSILMPMEHSQE